MKGVGQAKTDLGQERLSLRADAWAIGARAKRPCLAWEQGPLKGILGNAAGSIIPSPTWPVLPTPAAADSDFEDRSWSEVVPLWEPRAAKWMKSSLHSSSWVDVLDHKRSAALERWKVLVMSSGEATALGRSILEAQRSEDPAAVDVSIADAFHRKATSTLRTRAASLLMFCRWRATEGGTATAGIFPLDEPTVYNYVAHLRSTKAPRTRAPRFLEALGFAKGVLGAEVQNILESARIRGAAEGSAEVSVRKAPPLTGAQVKFLEWFAANAEGQEAVFVGHVCFCIHARLRWGDSQHCAFEPFLDVSGGKGFVEASLYNHKTAQRTTVLRNRLLPAVGITPGISGLDWASKWLDNRALLGLVASRGEPTMPAPKVGGGWAKIPLSSDEAATWLREILRAHDVPSLGPGGGTRSFKPTILSWMSKAGAPQGLQRLAGYHVEPGAKNPLEYGRDAMAPVLGFIEGLLDVISRGFFDPDRTRSGRWMGCRSFDDALRRLSDSSGAGVPPGFHGEEEADLITAPEVGDALSPEEPLEPGIASPEPDVLGREHDSSEGQLESECVSSSVSLQDEEESEDAERMAELAGGQVAEAIQGAADALEGSFFRHVVSGVLHRARILNPDSDGETTVFFCGRQANANYTETKGCSIYEPRKCARCWSER